MVEEMLTKRAGEPMEVHDAQLARALPMFDVHQYVADFSANIMPGYKTGRADRGLPVDSGLARSIIPPATAAARDFSTLAPRIPQLIADACVGCMACVNACPDTAILATAQPRAALERINLGFLGGTQADPAHDGDQISARSSRETQKYATVPERKRHRAGAVRDLRRPDQLQGMRRMRRGVRPPGPQRAAHDRQGAGDGHDAVNGRRIPRHSSASSIRSRRRRRSIATRRRLPT